MQYMSVLSIWNGQFDKDKVVLEYMFVIDYAHARPTFQAFFTSIVSSEYVMCDIWGIIGIFHTYNPIFEHEILIW